MPKETVGEAAVLYTDDHPPRKDSPTYVAARKVLMNTRKGGCIVCGGLPDMTHPELFGVADSKGLEDHHGGGIYVKDVLVALNLFGTEWSLGFSADPKIVAKMVENLNVVLTALGEATYDKPITNTEEVMLFVDSTFNANVKLCAIPETRVRMADGTERRIADVVPGDIVLGGDGLPHEVYAVASRDYEGEIVSAGNGPWLTPDHAVMRPEGWTAVGDVTSDDHLYRVEPSLNDPIRTPLGISHVELAVVPDRVSHRVQVTVAGDVVGDPWPVPVVASRLDDDALLHQEGVGDVLAEACLGLVLHAACVEGGVERFFQPRRVTTFGSAFPVVVVQPETFAGAVSRVGSGSLEVLLARPAGSHADGAHLGVQQGHASGVCIAPPPALVGAVATTSPRWSNDVGRSTFGAGHDDASALGSFAPTAGYWCPVGQIRRRVYTGKVHDISIRSAESFVADDILIHNCKPHHTGRMDRPSKDVNGIEAVGIHEIPFPIWLGQITCEFGRWDMWAGTSGTIAVAPDPDGGGAIVMHADPAHHGSLTRGAVLASTHPLAIAARKR